MVVREEWVGEEGSEQACAATGELWRRGEVEERAGSGFDRQQRWDVLSGASGSRTGQQN